MSHVLFATGPSNKRLKPARNSDFIRTYLPPRQCPAVSTRDKTVGVTDDDEGREGQVRSCRSLITPPWPPPLQKKIMNPWQYPQSTEIFYSPVSSHYAQAYLHNSLRGLPQQTPTQTAPSTSTSASTFQPRPRHKGTHRCTYDQCTFSGSQKAVEIHMMDRHLIYPPNYNNSKQREWDADPSLKGYVFSVSHGILHLLSFIATSSNLSQESPSSSREPT